MIRLLCRVHDDASIEGASTEMEVSVQPCLRGPFKIPEGYDKASPVYMIEGSVKRTATIRINHHANIESEEDRRNMVFLRSDNISQGEKSKLSFHFNIVQGGDASFEIGKDVGEITVEELTPMCVATKRSIDGRNWVEGCKCQQDTLA